MGVLRKGLAICALTVIGMLGAADTARGHGKTLDTYTFKRVLNVVGAQEMLTHQMCADVALLALGVNPNETLDRLQRSRDQFKRNLKGLRHGDGELGLPVTKIEAILDKIGQVEQQWASLDAAMEAKALPDAFTSGAIAELSVLHHHLVSGIQEVSRSYLEEPSIGLFSMLVNSLAVAAGQRTLTQKMLNQFAMIAQGYEVDSNRAELAENTSKFEETLVGLTDGDWDRQLMAAPTPAIYDQLLRTKQVWLEFRQHMESAAEGKTLDQQTVQQVLRLNARLFEETDKVVTMYEAL